MGAVKRSSRPRELEDRQPATRSDGRGSSSPYAYTQAWRLGIKALATTATARRPARRCATRRAGEAPAAGELSQRCRRSSRAGACQSAARWSGPREQAGSFVFFFFRASAQSITQSFPEKTRRATRATSRPACTRDGSVGEIPAGHRQEGSTMRWMMKLVRDGHHRSRITVRVPLETLVQKFATCASTRGDHARTQNPVAKFDPELHIMRWRASRFLDTEPGGARPSSPQVAARQAAQEGRAVGQGSDRRTGRRGRTHRDDAPQASSRQRRKRRLERTRCVVHRHPRRS